MLEIVTFRGHTISALSTLVGDGRWRASYTVCRYGERIRISSEAPFQSSRELAESAAILLAIQYVEDRLRRPQ
ncbi:MAG: hypothetical protein JWM30_3466 [Burkholderia sp.]|nr:hypothetical protein [Burkholderia sp.]